MKTLLLILMLACAFACSNSSTSEFVSMSKSSVVKVDAGTLGNLPGNWDWVSFNDCWAAVHKARLRVFTSPDGTMLRIRGTMVNETATKLAAVSLLVLAANNVDLNASVSKKDLAALIQADIDASDIACPDCVEVGFTFPIVDIQGL